MRIVSILENQKVEKRIANFVDDTTKTHCSEDLNGAF